MPSGFEMTISGGVGMALSRSQWETRGSYHGSRIFRKKQ